MRMPTKPATPLKARAEDEAQRAPRAQRRQDGEDDAGEDHDEDRDGAVLAAEEGHRTVTDRRAISCMSAVPGSAALTTRA
jgi:hypothetical protein